MRVSNRCEARAGFVQVADQLDARYCETAARLRRVRDLCEIILFLKQGSSPLQIMISVSRRSCVFAPEQSQGPEAEDELHKL